MMAARKPRSIEQSVIDTLGRLTGQDRGIKPTLRLMALDLARKIDSFSRSDAEAYSAAQMSALVKAHQQLALMLNRLADVEGEPDGFDERMGQPEQPAGGSAVSSTVGDATVAGAGDAGATGGGDSPPAR